MRIRRFSQSDIRIQTTGEGQTVLPKGSFALFFHVLFPKLHHDETFPELVSYPISLLLDILLFNGGSRKEAGYESHSGNPGVTRKAKSRIFATRAAIPSD